MMFQRYILFVLVSTISGERLFLESFEAQQESLREIAKETVTSESKYVWSILSNKIHICKHG
jgi:hypothetical protein